MQMFSDIKNKTVEQLKALRDIGLNEISLGVESGDDWTLQRINKGYTSADILEQCHKLEEAQRGEFTPLSEKELMEELKLFVENLECDCEFNTHQIIAALQYGIDHYDMDRLTAIRNNKRTL